MDELSPCRICGGKEKLIDIVVSDRDGLAKLICKSCGDVSFEELYSDDVALVEWNRRYDNG